MQHRSDVEYTIGLFIGRHVKHVSICHFMLIRDKAIVVVRVFLKGGGGAVHSNTRHRWCGLLLRTAENTDVQSTKNP